MNIIVIFYSRSERERAAAEGRERRSKLVRKRQIDVDLEAGEMEEEEDEPEITVTQPVRELCSTVDAFIYIVDSTQEDNKGIGSLQLTEINLYPIYDYAKDGEPGAV